jgi:uncharacterized protein
MNFKFTVRSANLNPEDAQNLAQLGQSLEKGMGLTRDYTTAYELFKLAGAAGNGDAMCGLGRCYLNGYGAERDVEQAAAWFEKAARKGNLEAMTSLANILSEPAGQDMAAYFKSALKWYRKAAEAGEPEAKFGLARMYHYGRGVRRNYKKAGIAFLELAKAGYIPAYVYVGLNLQHGYYFDPNFEAALNVYGLGAQNDDPPCMRQLAIMYDEGLGLEQNYTIALYWYKKAAAAGDTQAMERLADMYECGRGVRKNRKKAEELRAQARL